MKLPQIVSKIIYSMSLNTHVPHLMYPAIIRI